MIFMVTWEGEPFLLKCTRLYRINPWTVSGPFLGTLKCTHLIRFEPLTSCLKVNDFITAMSFGGGYELWRGCDIDSLTLNRR